MRRRDSSPASALLAAGAQHVSGLLARDPVVVQTAGTWLPKLGRPVDAAPASEDTAGLLTDPAQRIAALREAQRIWETIGATADTARLLDEIEAAGPWHGLTIAERAVAELVAGGLTNREAARRLGVSPHTVDDHLRSVFAKLGVHSRVELMQLRHGAVE